MVNGLRVTSPTHKKDQQAGSPRQEGGHILQGQAAEQAAVHEQQRFKAKKQAG
jgi:hypothetical protein